MSELTNLESKKRRRIPLPLLLVVGGLSVVQLLNSLPDPKDNISSDIHAEAAYTLEQQARITAFAQKLNLPSLGLKAELEPFAEASILGRLDVSLGRCEDTFDIYIRGTDNQVHLGSTNDTDNPFAIVRGNSVVGYVDETPQNLAAAFPAACKS